jgi:endonuclease YncB( thermonuclease family)
MKVNQAATRCSHHHHPKFLRAQTFSVLSVSALLVSGPMAAAPPVAWAKGSDQAKVIQGQARVVDGDTLAIESAKIRLWAVDAPEKAQSCKHRDGSEYMCGLASKQALEGKINGQTVTCKVKATDQYGRNVAVCNIGKEDLNAWLVSRGLVVSYKQYSNKEYAMLEEKAREAELGIWEGDFVTPSVWRKQQKAEEGRGGFGNLSAEVKVSSKQVAGALTPECPTRSPIKGNIGKKGAKAYYTPGTSKYDSVKIDESKGERCFSSVEEAEGAGWQAK